MRVSNQAVYDAITNNLANASDAMLRANQVVSSGKKINRLSDDPVGLVSVINLRSSLANIGQLERNIAMGKSWLNAGESALRQMEGILTETKTLCIQMANGTNGATERENAAVAVEGHLQQILSLANTQVDGRYIFSGTRTDTAPYDPDDWKEYQGNETPFEVRIGKDMNLSVGRTGPEIFGEDGEADNIFETLSDLKASLNGNDVDGIQEAMGNLDAHMDHLRTLTSDTGAKHQRMETKETIIQDLRLSYTERKSGIEDADIAEAIMELKAKETAYQAALAGSSKVMNMSLVNYL